MSRYRSSERYFERKARRLRKRRRRKLDPKVASKIPKLKSVCKGAGLSHWRVSRMGIPKITLAKARRSGQLRSTCKGHRILYRGQWVIDWLELEVRPAATGMQADRQPPPELSEQV